MNAAATTAILGALYLPAIYYDGLILKTSPATFLVALALGLVARAVERGRPARWFAVGLCVGTAVQAVVDWTLQQPGNEEVRSVNAVVGETNDG